MKTQSWFEVDRQGLAKLQERRGKEFVLYELVQNAWDQDVTTVTIELHKSSKEHRARILIEDDDPKGFNDLSHAFTLFAESEKKSNPTKRGRFNLGEKLVLSLCSEAEIITTTGGVRFDDKGRHTLRQKRQRGSQFTGVLKMTNAEFEQCIIAMRRLIVPSHIKTSFLAARGSDIQEFLLSTRNPIAEFEATLSTEKSDEEGYLRPTKRNTIVKVYQPNNEVGTLYEMGIPVVETGDSFHVDVGQKVPLTIERDNVRPAFLRDVRTLVLNAMHGQITKEDANKSWVRDALADEQIDSEAVRTIIHHRIGFKSVAFDPSDQEANKRAVSRGYVVVTGNQFSKDEWINIRKASVLPSAGKVTPTPKPFSEDGKPTEIILPDEMTEAELRVIRTMRNISTILLGFTPNIVLVKRMNVGFGAAYGSGNMYLSRNQLGKSFFADCFMKLQMTEQAIDLLIHELGHEYCSDHLSDKYYAALTRLGAKLALAVADNHKLLNV